MEALSPMFWIYKGLKDSIFSALKCEKETFSPQVLAQDMHLFASFSGEHVARQNAWQM